jgi:YidC/Oxa1 family membrane protein insertase
MNEEMMKLYKEHGVNPFGGCLPLVMQFPVLIGLFYVIRTPLQYMGYANEKVGEFLQWSPITGNLPAILERVQGSALARGLDTVPLDFNRFLGLRLDCSPSLVLSGGTSETVPVACGSGPISFLPYLVLILAMGWTTYYQQKQMQARQGDQSAQMAQMQTFMKIMPLMLMVFSFNFPTGVVLYWLTTNVWTIAQQRIILKAAPPIAPAQKKDADKASDDGAKKPVPKKEAAGGASPKAKSGNGRQGQSRAKNSKKKKRR